ncbi:MAG TPA: DUF4160 domain-containing protein [Anaerolineales bacterium]|nr:DUF4160 domain-containing protein [Anaerolineales bacterium]
MPSITIDGWTFLFWSVDCQEPPHVHVRDGHKRAKIWLRKLTFAHVRGYNEHDQRQIMRVVRDNREKLLEVWNEHCSKA